MDTYVDGVGQLLPILCLLIGFTRHVLVSELLLAHLSGFKVGILLSILGDFDPVLALDVHSLLIDFDEAMVVVGLLL